MVSKKTTVFAIPVHQFPSEKRSVRKLPVLIAQNLTLNSDAAPDNKYMFDAYRGPLPYLWNITFITKMYLYNIDPLKSHFYIVKLGFTGLYIIFVISAHNIDCGYSLEPPRRGGSNEYPQSMFWTEIWKLSEFFVWKIAIFGW